jgi:predicted regulator of Ras-like GTPase activity (Roadblock/LC7/MglB family)
VVGDVAVELARLKGRVTGVTGGVLAAADGLLIGYDGGEEYDPHDLAAVAAAAYGIGSQAGRVLEQGDNQHVAIRSEHGYYVVVSIGETALLGVVADSGLNLAQLHLELRNMVDRLGEIARSFMDSRAALDDPR